MIDIFLNNYCITSWIHIPPLSLPPLPLYLPPSFLFSLFAFLCFPHYLKRDGVATSTDVKQTPQTNQSKITEAESGAHQSNPTPRFQQQTLTPLSHLRAPLCASLSYHNTPQLYMTSFNSLTPEIYSK